MSPVLCLYCLYPFLDASTGLSPFVYGPCARRRRRKRARTTARGLPRPSSTMDPAWWAHAPQPTAACSLSVWLEGPNTALPLRGCALGRTEVTSRGQLRRGRNRRVTSERCERRQQAKQRAVPACMPACLPVILPSSLYYELRSASLDACARARSDSMTNGQRQRDNKIILPPYTILILDKSNSLNFN